MRYATTRTLLTTLTVGVAGLAAPAALACDTCAGHTHAPGETHSHDTPTGTPLAQNVTRMGPGTGTFRFVVVGDTQGGSGTNPFMPQLISSINEVDPANILLAGDLVGTGGSGGSGTWNQWINSASAFNGGLENIYMTPGNHDQPVGTDSLWQSTFDQTPGNQAWLPDSQNIGGVSGIDQMDYYIDTGSIRYISVTTDTSQYGASVLSNQSLAWLEAAIDDADSNNAIEDVFVFTHHPVTFDSTFTSTNNAGTRSDFWQAIADDSDKFRALFTGHWHLYQPSTPDPNNPDVWEVVGGTGGGGLEGRVQQNQHGFTTIDVHDNGRIEATFYGDADGSTNGWEFNDIMDQFVIADPNPRPEGIVGYYSFNFGSQNLDTAPGPLAKQNHGRFHGNATTVASVINGDALIVDGSGDYADGAALGDYNLAINRDLTLSVHANFDTLASGELENTLVAYGSALYDNLGSTSLSESEAVNIVYNLSIRDDGHLQMLWEHDNGVDVVLTSTESADIDTDEWHHYVVSRDADAMLLRFFVDGEQLGDAVVFTELPTGGGSGFLHVGSSLYGVRGFDGMIDELSIYNTVLLPGQVFIGPKAGDIDGDGIVDLSDFDILLAHFGDEIAEAGSTQTLAQGDLDFDGDVDFADFDAFQSAYLAANPGAAPLSIPEPGSLALLALGGLLFKRRL
ncbi:metallophosphoesterase [Phycisphaeraceae bacterium D3-23]